MMIGHYSPFCICTSCGNRAFWDSLTSMTDVQILQHVEGRVMDEKQEKIIEMVRERVKLVEWNACMKGEAS